MINIIKQPIAVTDTETFAMLPEELRAFLMKFNGIVAFKGGLQVWACVYEPSWLSLKEIWIGAKNLHGVYTYVKETDIPFAQDCFGDQYLWREGMIVKLNAEYGEVEEVAPSIDAFMEALQQDPVDYLVLESFEAYLANGNTFEAGQLINVYPPFTMNSANERVLKAVPADEQHKFLKTFYQQIKPLAEGSNQ